MISDDKEAGRGLLTKVDSEEGKGRQRKRGAYAEARERDGVKHGLRQQKAAV